MVADDGGWHVGSNRRLSLPERAVVEHERKGVQWTCPACTYLNYLDRTACRQCNANQPLLVALSYRTLDHAPKADGPLSVGTIVPLPKLFSLLPAPAGPAGPHMVVPPPPVLDPWTKELPWLAPWEELMWNDEWKSPALPDPGLAWHPSTGSDHATFLAQIARARREHGASLSQAMTSCPPYYIRGLQEQVHRSHTHLQDGLGILADSRTAVATTGGEHASNVRVVELLYTELMTATRQARASGQIWQEALKAHTTAHSCYATFLDDHNTNNAGLSAGWVRMEAAALLYLVDHPGRFPWPRAHDKVPSARYTPPAGALVACTTPPPPPQVPLWERTPLPVAPEPGAVAAVGATLGPTPPPPAPPARPTVANDLTAAQPALQPAPQPAPAPTVSAPELAKKPDMKPEPEGTPLPALTQV